MRFSMLHRLVADAALTLDNKKAVDIIVANEDGSTTIIDGKGLEKRYDWPFDDTKLVHTQRHFYVLVCFDGKITDPNIPPSAWIVPAKEIPQFIKKYRTRTVVSRMNVIANGQKYFQDWSQLIGAAE